MKKDGIKWNGTAIKYNWTNRKELLYLGKTYQFLINVFPSVTYQNVAQIGLDEQKQEIQLFHSGVKWKDSEYKDVLEQWYRERARKYITDRVEYYSRKILCTYGTIRIKNQKTCWGSCSSKGNLNFNWRIIMAPPEIVDYLVVHELCHRLEMNHSKEFWALVERQMPDYKIRRKWLKDNGKDLVW